MRLASIHTYPVKGCYRVDQDTATVEPWGLAGDRRWLVVDAGTGRAVTQREHAGLTQVRPSVATGALILRTTGMPDLTVPEPVGGEHAEVTVWQFTGVAALAGPAADDWLTTFLDRKVRLVWMDDPRRRAVPPDRGLPGDTVSFADGYPVLLANAASLGDLNDRIAESGSWEGPLPMTRFRPNLIMTGSPAWAEDTFLGRRVRIGEVVFRAPRPCGRCVVTTTDQETGERGVEPLRTLARFRNVDQKLLFGVNLIPDTTGAVTAGDLVVPLDD